MPITSASGIVIVMSTSLPSGSAADRAFAGVPFLAAAPAGAGNALPAPVFGAVANGVRDGDVVANAAHLPAPVFSSADSGEHAGERTPRRRRRAKASELDRGALAR